MNFDGSKFPVHWGRDALAARQARGPEPFRQAQGPEPVEVLAERVAFFRTTATGASPLQCTIGGLSPSHDEMFGSQKDS